MLQGSFDAEVSRAGPALAGVVLEVLLRILLRSLNRVDRHSLLFLGH